jgi:hypothetical protein
MEIGGIPPWVFFVSVHFTGVEVLCFDTVLQVFILNGLWLVFVCYLVIFNRWKLDGGTAGTACRAPTSRL